jgi:hypothetical protein
LYALRASGIGGNLREDVITGLQLQRAEPAFFIVERTAKQGNDLVFAQLIQHVYAGA